MMALANPDLIARLKQAASLNEPRVPLYYAGVGAEGYIDYPALEDA